MAFVSQLCAFEVLTPSPFSCSYGVVHLCIDKATGQKKAAKIMPKLRAKQSPERTQRKLEREVALMTRISRESRAVAQLVDVFEDRLYVYIVMDLLEGGDLEQLLEVSTFSTWYCL